MRVSFKLIFCCLTLFSSTGNCAFSSEQLKKSVTAFQEFAEPIVAQKNLKLKMFLDEDWDSNLGGSSVQGDTFTISLGSEVNLTVDLTASELAFIFCHELGHLMGEGPRKPNRDGEWAAAEGEADYYAGSCMPKFLKFQNGSAEPGLIAERFFQMIYGFFAGSLPQAKPSLSQKDPSVSDKYILGYPSLQCRLDSAVAGNLGQQRPICWYNH